MGRPRAEPDGDDVIEYTFAHARTGTLTLLQRIVRDRDVSGLWVWSAGHALSHWLCTAEAEKELDLRTVALSIELGCGTGLVSLALARLGTRSVLATDGEEETVRQCECNAAANGLALSVRTLTLPWGDAAAAKMVMDAAAPALQPPSHVLVVGTDILYDIGEYDALEETLRELVRRYASMGGGRMDVLLAWTTRTNAERGFLQRFGDLTPLTTRSFSSSLGHDRSSGLTEHGRGASMVSIGVLRIDVVAQTEPANDPLEVPPLASLARFARWPLVQWCRWLLPPMNLAERVLCASAVDARAALGRTRVAPFGDGVLVPPSMRAAGVDWRHWLPGGLGATEMLRELTLVLHGHGTATPRLSLDEATEAVRRTLRRLDPWRGLEPGSQWTEADCRAIATSLVCAGGTTTEPSETPAPEPPHHSPRDSSSGATTALPTPAAAAVPPTPIEIPLEPRWPALPDACHHPPWWLEAAQVLLYYISYWALLALGLRARWAQRPDGCLMWYDSGSGSAHAQHDGVGVGVGDGDGGDGGGGDGGSSSDGGSGDGDVPMVCIHGMFTTAASMAPLALLLSETRRVLSVDLPGIDYSFSTPREPPRPGDARAVSLDACVAEIMWLIDVELARHAKVDLCAHSFGANVAVAVARARPERVRHLHLLAPGGAGAASFASFTGSVDWDRVPSIIRPSLLAIFVSPNLCNLVFDPARSYVRAARRQHAATPLVTPCQLIFASADTFVQPRPANGLGASFPSGSALVLRRGTHQLNVLNASSVCDAIVGYAAARRASTKRHGAASTSSAPVMPSRRPLRMALVRRILAALDALTGVVVEPMPLGSETVRSQGQAVQVSSTAIDADGGSVRRRLAASEWTKM